MTKNALQDTENGARQHEENAPSYVRIAFLRRKYNGFWKTRLETNPKKAQNTPTNRPWHGIILIEKRSETCALRVTYIWSSAAPQRYEIRASEGKSLNFMTKRPTNVSFSCNFEKSMVHEKPLVQHNSFACNSFAPCHRFMAPPERIRVAKKNC